LARSNIARPFIRFEMKRSSGRTALEFKNVNKSYDDLHVIKNFSASLQRGEKIALMGRNAMGKTTLLKALLANAPGVDDPDVGLDSGTVTWGHEVQVGYFAQDHRGSIRNGTTVEEWLHEWDPQAAKEEIRGLLGQMLFRGEEGTKPTDALSGGEAARLMFCKLMLQKPNFLVFDEPSNHLDLEAISALSTALQKFDGTVLLVTHDEDMVSEVATRIWHFERKINDFSGSYEEYTAGATSR
jgi:ATPase subunit of ABC transporter with duplicated ATPase domains